MLNHVRDILKSVFGYSEFRGDQEAIISHTLAGGNSLVLMPTGMGKSLCFQIPARLFAQKGTTLVVSPLIALMKDQVDQARQKGFRVTFINSSLCREEREKRQLALARGEYELVYVTPERFKKEEFWNALLQTQVTLFAIDEAHCISEWGHDFRPDYTRLADVRKRLGLPITMALTATATPEVQREILKYLDLNESSTPIFHSGLDRPNLHLRVYSAYGLDDKVRAFMAYHLGFSGPCIVYFSLISTLSAFSRELRKLSVEHVVYHGDLSDRHRRANQDQFIQGRSSLILATPAFGLGINKPDIRKVIHGEIPGSLEAYYQEIGRAGRDGETSECSLLFDPDDVSIQTDFMKWANPEADFIRSVYTLIERNEGRVNAEGIDFLRSQMNFYNSRDYRVETSVQLLERWGAIAYYPDDPTPTRFSQGVIKALEFPEGEWIDSKHQHIRMQNQRRQLLQMVQYASQQTECRRNLILSYFGFSNPSPCGVCDVCRSEVHA